MRCFKLFGMSAAKAPKSYGSATLIWNNKAVDSDVFVYGNNGRRTVALAFCSWCQPI
jgi:hypothetical protein